MLLRSSLRLSAPRKKASLSSIRSFTAPNSPNLVVIPRYLNLQRASSSISASSFGYPFCRICHDTSGSSFRNGADMDGSLGKLIAPCLCDGSLKHVHEKCIQRWIEISHAKKCELCRFEYEMSTYMKPLKEVSILLNLCRGPLSTLVWSNWIFFFLVEMLSNQLRRISKVVLLYRRLHPNSN